MKDTQIKGVISAMVTPMDDDEIISKHKTRQLTNYLIDSGAHGLFCLGTVGESYALTEMEKLNFLKVVIDEARGRIPIYAGTGAVTTRAVIDFTKKVQKLDVAAVSIVSPYFVTPSQQELYMHYKRIAEAVDLPVLLYNIPVRTGVHLDVATVARLSEIENIVGIKDSSGDIKNIKGYIDHSQEGFSVLAGSDDLIYDALSYGGAGAVAATTNIVAELVVSIYEYFTKGELEQSKLAQEKLVPLCQAFSYGTVPGNLKHVVNLIGKDVGPARLPVTGLEGEGLVKIKSLLESNYR